MSRLFFGGAEAQHIHADAPLVLPAGRTIAYDTGTTRGAWSKAAYKFRAGSGNVDQVRLPWTQVSGRTFYARFVVAFDANPASNQTLFQIKSGGTSIESITLRTDGKLVAPDGTFSAVLSTNTFYVVELSTVGNGTTVTSAMRVDGTAVGGTHGVTTAVLPDRVEMGNLGSSANFPNVWMDDWALNDDQGSDQNSWCDTKGKVLLSLPSSDNAIGTDWTLGSGGAPGGNAFDSVNNEPPVGVAFTTGGSDAKSIKDAASSTTAPASNADLKMQSYTTAGLATGDIVKVVLPIAEIGNSSSTSRTLALFLVSNPAEGAESTLAITGTAGTYPTTWTLMQNAVIHSPSVTLGTQPVLRIGKRTASGTVGACLMGLYIEFETPATQTLTATGIASAEAFGTAIVELSLHPTGITSAEAFGTATLQYALHATGITSSEAFGTAKVQLSLHATGIASAEAFGAAVVQAVGNLVATGIPSAQAFGTAKLNLNLVATGIASAEAFGTAVIPSPQTLTASAIASLEAFGTASIADVPPVARVSATFKDRWASGQQVGAAMPTMRSQIRLGRFNRGYDTWAGPPIGVTIAGSSHTDQPWQAFWEPTTDWVELPNVYSCDQTKDFEANGIDVATVVLENVFYTAETGDYHAIRRGFMAPLRGYVADGRTQLTDEQGDPVAENDWFGILVRDAQIDVWESYGDEEVRTFTGLIDDVDTTSRPDKITLTCRSFGKVLADERMFGWNKDPEIKDPVIFIGADAADKVTRVATAAVASSALDSEHQSDNVIDGNADTTWRSETHTSSTVTEYIEIHLPQGRYDDYVLFPEYNGMGFYVSIFTRQWTDDSGGVHNPTRDGADIVPDQWDDRSGGALVPGANGGITYVGYVASSTSASAVRTLGASYVTGDDTILRISFRPLAPTVTAGVWIAGVRDFFGRARQVNPDAATQKWVIVQDISDVVRCVLRWAGFKEWEVEDAGVALPKRMLFNRGSTYMDVIKAMADAIGYVFYLKDPTLADASIGVPVFRKSFVVVDSVTAIGTVTDRDLLTAIAVKQTDESLAYIIRVRGRESSDGQTLGGDSSRRVMYTFGPNSSGEPSLPWRGTPPDFTDTRLAGVIKHVIHANNLFRTVDDCKFAAFYIALQEALESVKATIDIPANPAFDLDEHVVLMDLGTGLTTRMAIATRTMSFQYGENTHWTMTLGGALIDTPDVRDMVAIIDAAARGTA